MKKGRPNEVLAPPWTNDAIVAAPRRLIGQYEHVYEKLIFPKFGIDLYEDEGPSSHDWRPNQRARDALVAPCGRLAEHGQPLALMGDCLGSGPKTLSASRCANAGRKARLMGGTADRAMAALGSRSFYRAECALLGRNIRRYRLHSLRHELKVTRDRHF